ncbi:MAG: DUF2782 domain-containing protein [Gammaproteobacteria bacterium]|nr:MAG: DUF2782 domain-containing protein [Gammaproteobacteria bacterium]
MKHLPVLLAALLPLPALAQPASDAVPELPQELLDRNAPPPTVEGPPDRELAEPEVNIIHRGNRTIEEYRHNGQLYMVRIVPSKGRPYYLIDADGDGDLETRRFELEPAQVMPSWVLFRW